jgi:predicted nucleic acid-binding Zn ribbon protein
MSDLETRDPAATPGGEGQGAGAAPAATGEAPARHCPRCGAGLRPDQDWCLNCGAAVTTEIRRPRGWRLPLALVSTVAVLALAAIVVAFIGVADDRETVAQASPTPSPTVSPAPTVTPTPSPGVTGTPTPTATTDAGATPSVPGFEDDGTAGGTDGGVDDGTDSGVDGGTGTGTTGDGAYDSWPAGEAAWTVVLYSGLTREAAEERADEIEASGTSVGILESDEFSTLNAGYWVVYSGQYDTREAAQSSAESLSAAADDAYARYVDPR